MATLREIENKLNEVQKEFAEFKVKYRKKLAIGGTIEIGDIKWLILDKTAGGYFAITADSIGNRKFGKNNDWKESDIREYLNTEFLKKIEEDIGCGVLHPFKRDLLSLDGQEEYGTCEDEVSIISLDEYRKYRKLLPYTKYYWWTLTPDSTKCNDDTTWIRVVFPSGRIRGGSCDTSLGVRPVCIFPSEIFESEEQRWVTQRNFR